jgi:hypothetical protein
MPDLDQLGELAGLKLKEVRELTAPVADPAADDDASDDASGSSEDTPRDTAAKIKARVGSQVSKAFEQGKWGSDLQIDLGFRKKLQKQFHLAGTDPSRADKFFSTMEDFTRETVKVPFESSGDYMQVFSNMVDRQLEDVLR